MESFKYTPLPTPESFRVLILEAGKAGDGIQCHLEVHQVTSKLGYEALSYVWGTSTRSALLSIDGGQAFIIPTLEILLRRLRLPKATRTLWIDQDNLEERSQQVQLMRLIYSSAKNVLVWLGEDEKKQAAGAKELIERIDKAWIDSLTSAASSPGNDGLRNFGLPPRDSTQWQNLAEMLESPYFKRIWVVQECRVASAITLMWGFEEISWLSFFHMWL